MLEAQLDTPMKETPPRATIACMTFHLPDGQVIPFEYNFGPDYPENAAEFMFFDGNYSCDCNKCRFLAELGFDVSYVQSLNTTDYLAIQGPNDDPPDTTDFLCGDYIRIEDFRVEFRPADPKQLFTYRSPK